MTTVDLVQKLKPHVTTFSAAISSQYEHGDQIVVGGAITDMFDMTALHGSVEEEGADEAGVYLTLDDGVGETKVVLPQMAFHEAQESHGSLDVGKVVLVTGRIYRLDTTHTYESKTGKTTTTDNHEQETLRIVAWEISPLPEEEKRVVKSVVKPKE